MADRVRRQAARGAATAAALGLAAGVGACAGMRAPVALLSLRLRSSGGGAIRAKDGALTQALDRVLVFAALADAALDTSSGGRRLSDQLAMPWRVAAGALGAVATREAKPWAAALLLGAAMAWLGQKAERDCRRELTCAGIPPVLVGLTEEAVALSLPFVWRRQPALGLVCVPLSLGLIAAARGRKVTRYVTLGEVPRRVPPCARTAGARATVSRPSSPGAARGVRTRPPATPPPADAH